VRGRVEQGIGLIDPVLVRLHLLVVAHLRSNVLGVAGEFSSYAKVYVFPDQALVPTVPD
jgi:hypothetical protein